ncbi:MAG: FxDxF family PEP-CTERM protein [Pseudomonadota bacterium]
MKYSRLALACALAAGVALPAAAASSASRNLTLFNPFNVGFSASQTFGGTVTDTFEFDLSGVVASGTYSSFTFSIPGFGAGGFQPLAISFDGVDFVGQTFSGPLQSYYAFALPPTLLNPGKHTLTVSGIYGASGGSYSGTITSAVPEPSTYAMLLAGLLAIGGMVLTRRSH